jgi:PAS domain S-box-containing protein
MTAHDEINFGNFFNDIDDFLFVLDLQGNIVEINNAVISILGYSKDELIGESILTVHPPELREKAQIIVGQMLTGKKSICPLPLLSKNNNHFPVETRIYHGNWNSEKVLIGVSRNLSEITLSEDKFFKVFNNSQILMAITEVESGTFVNVNKQFLQILGYTKDEIIGKNSQELNLFYDNKKRCDIIRKLNGYESIENEEVVIQTKSGELLHSYFSMSKIQTQTHNYLLTSANNVTQLKNAEARLIHNLKQQTLLADIAQKLNSNHNISINLFDTLQLIGEHTDVSRAYIFEDNENGNKITNTFEWCNNGILPQKHKLQMVPYENAPSWKKVLKDHGKIFSTNIKELPNDIFKILEHQEIKSVLIFPLYVQDNFFGFIGFDECTKNKIWELDDIELLRAISHLISGTFERIYYNKKITESEIQLKMAITNTEVGLWDWNIITGDVYFSDIWCNMLGYEKSEIEPNISSWERLIHPEDMPKVKILISKHLSGESTTYISTHRLLTKSGTWKWVIDKGKVTEWDKNGKPSRAIGTYSDIDNQMKIENELRIANATKDKFFSIIGHDLRGPIGSMMQISEQISEKGNVDEETLYRVLGFQKEVTRSTFHLLENILNWARYNQENLLFNPKVIDVNEAISENIEIIRYLAVKKNLSITHNNSGSINAYADMDMIKLVIRNVLSNSIKFTRNGGLIKIEIHDEQDFVNIKIIDSGVGISQENIKKILSEEEFFTTCGTEREKGSGLGLKLCKTFIAINQGVLSINSDINKGTTFSFSLPKEAKSDTNHNS